MNPYKARCGSGGDPSTAEVATRSGDHAADEQTDDDGTGFHDWGSEALREDDGDEDEETQADELR